VTDPTVNNGWGVSANGSFTGYWYTFSDNADGGTSTISPICDTPCFSAAGTSVCVSGTAAQVPDELSYGTYWGVGLGWNLKQAEAPPNEPAMADLSGYSTVTIGLQVNTPSPIRAKLDFGDATNYCVSAFANGANSLTLTTDFVGECWEGGKALPLQPSLLAAVKAIQIQVPTSMSAPTPFDFCVTQVTFQ
jgi:hypothetical protein